MKSIYFLSLFSTLFSISTLAATDCSNAPALQIKLYSEEHGTVAADERWTQLLSEASNGDSRVFFEAIPRSANSNLDEKNMYIQEMVDAGYRVSSAGRSNIFGMDSNELKFISVASGMYILNAFDGVMRDPVYLDYLLISMDQPGVKEALMSSPNYAKTYGEILKLDFESFSSMLTRSFQQAPDSFRAFLLSSINTMIQHVENQGLVLFKPDLAAFAIKGDPFKNDQQWITYSIGDRNKYMVDSILEVVCNSTSTVPVMLSIGFQHARGMEQLLKTALPNSDIAIIPH